MCERNTGSAGFQPASGSFLGCTRRQDAPALPLPITGCGAVTGSVGSAKDAVVAQPARPVRRPFDTSATWKNFSCRFTEMDFRWTPSFSAAANAQPQKPRRVSAAPPSAPGGAGTSELFQRTIFVANLQATFFAAGPSASNRGDQSMGLRVPSEVQNQASRETLFVRAEFQVPGAGKPAFWYGNGFAPAYIIVEEIRESEPPVSFSASRTNVEGIADRTSLPGQSPHSIGAQEIVKASADFSVRYSRRDDVEQKAKHLALSCNKKRYAGGWFVGARIFQPGVQAGLLGTLPLFGRPGFEFR